jgi:hypothetical protein
MELNMAVSFHSNFPGFKNVSINAESSAVTAILMENHTQLIIESLSADGEYELKMAHLRSYVDNGSFSPGEVTIKVFEPSDVVRFHDRTQTWQVSALKAQEIWKEICLEKENPVDHPVYFHPVGNSYSTSNWASAYVTDEKELNDIKKKNPSLFHSVCMLAEYFDNEIENADTKTFIHNLQRKVSLLDMNKLNYNLLNNAFKYNQEATFKDLYEGYPIGYEIYETVKKMYNNSRFNFKINKKENGMLDTFSFVKHFHHCMKKQLISKERCAVHNCSSWAFEKIEKMGVELRSDPIDLFIKIPGKLVSFNRTEQATTFPSMTPIFKFANCFNHSKEFNRESRLEVECFPIKRTQ